MKSPKQVRELLEDEKFASSIRRSLWYKGDLRFLLRPHGQSQIDQYIEQIQDADPSPEPFVIETHRRLGKSHYLLIRAVKRCLARPGTRFVYALPTVEMAKQIVVPNLARVLKTCPHELRPVKKKMEYIFKNPIWPEDSTPSVLDIVGMNQNPDSARGGGCDEACVDEAGYCDHLEYFITEVLGFQFIGRDRPTLTLVSTPPATMSHLFITKYIPDAKKVNRYLGIPASKNKDYTPRDKRMVIQICGGEDTIAYRREAEIEHITDLQKMVVPEFIEARQHIVKDFEPPPFYIPMIGMDLGYYPDYSHVLFGGVDFESQRILFFDEIQVRKETPAQIAERGLMLENKHWPRDDFPHRDKLRRVSDGTYLELAAFRDAGWSFEPVQKYDSDSCMAHFRRLVQEHKILIHPRCVQLIYQLDNVIWNDKFKDWVRNEMVGHGDGIKAAAYFCRHADLRSNPFPGPTRKPETFYQEDFTGKPRDDDNPIRRAFK